MKKLEYIPGDLCIVKGKVESVCEVDRDNDFSITTDQHPFIRLSEVKPIPLTSEILKKNGWRKTKIYYKLDLNNHQEVWACENHDYTYDILVGFKKDNILSTIKEGLKYVSELQNILFGLDLNHIMEV